VTDGATLPVVLLGVIAAATLVMALVQVAVVAVAARYARRADALLTKLDQDLRPVIANATAAAGHASRAAALAAAQAERADRLFAELAGRLDDTTATLQRGLLAPAREGRALLAGVQAALATILEARRLAMARRGAHDDDALFIG
jgi:hypothetical protein